MSKEKQREFENVDEIEHQLRTSLKPVSPSPDYIEQLHQRLTDASQLQVTFDRNKPIFYIIFGIVGFISFLLITVTTLRLLLSILGILGLVRYAKRRSIPEDLGSTKSFHSI